MPELPEVETVRRGLKPHLEGAVLAHVDLRRGDLRFPFPDGFVQAIAGQRVNSLERRAKYLLAHLQNGAVLVMHLGMTGRFIIDASPIEKGTGAGLMPGEFVHAAGHHAVHDHVVFRLDSGIAIRFNDARRFGYMTVIAAQELATHALFKNLGIEPLGGEFSPGYLAQRAANRSAPLKSFLLDQRHVAGLGNIYVSEALHRARLHPEKAAGVLATRSGRASAAAERLVPAITSVLQEAIAAGGSSLRDYRQANGDLGYFQHAFAVYGRQNEACQTAGCNGMIRRAVHGGRSTFFCPRCQR